MPLTTREFAILQTLHDLAAANAEACGKARVVAGVVRCGRVYAIGHNQRKSHPLQAASQAQLNPERIYLHAEIDALLLWHWLRDPRGVKLFVARAAMVEGRWVGALAKPCEGCMKFVQAIAPRLGVRVREIVWTKGGGQYGRVVL